MCYMGNYIDLASRAPVHPLQASVNDDGDLVTQNLSQDQTPFRADERERIRAHGGHVMTTSQLQGAEPMHEDWTLDGEPPRVWQIIDDDAKVRIGVGGTAGQAQVLHRLPFSQNGL